MTEDKTDFQKMLQYERECEERIKELEKLNNGLGEDNILLTKKNEKLEVKKLALEISCADYRTSIAELEKEVEMLREKLIISEAVRAEESKSNAFLLDKSKQLEFTEIKLKKENAELKKRVWKFISEYENGLRYHIDFYNIKEPPDMWTGQMKVITELKKIILSGEGEG